MGWKRVFENNRRKLIIVFLLSLLGTFLFLQTPDLKITGPDAGTEDLEALTQDLETLLFLSKVYMILYFPILPILPFLSYPLLFMPEALKGIYVFVFNFIYWYLVYSLIALVYGMIRK